MLTTSLYFEAVCPPTVATSAIRLGGLIGGLSPVSVSPGGVFPLNLESSRKINNKHE